MIGEKFMIKGKERLEEVDRLFSILAHYIENTNLLAGSLALGAGGIIPAHITNNCPVIKITVLQLIKML